MDRLYLVYATIGAVGVLLALVSRSLRQLPFSEPLVALLLGVVLGPQLLGLLEISESVRDPLPHRLWHVGLPRRRAGRGDA
jgi:NhaP-type Na+/H+ or K+/H+ antiporter